MLWVDNKGGKQAIDHVFIPRVVVSAVTRYINRVSLVRCHSDRRSSGGAFCMGGLCLSLALAVRPLTLFCDDHQRCVGLEVVCFF